jgi:hypothetical protein
MASLTAFGLRHSIICSMAIGSFSANRLIALAPSRSNSCSSNASFARSSAESFANPSSRASEARPDPRVLHQHNTASFAADQRSAPKFSPRREAHSASLIHVRGDLHGRNVASALMRSRLHNRTRDRGGEPIRLSSRAAFCLLSTVDPYALECPAHPDLEPCAPAANGRCRRGHAGYRPGTDCRCWIALGEIYASLALRTHERPVRRLPREDFALNLSAKRCLCNTVGGRVIEGASHWCAVSTARSRALATTNLARSNHSLVLRALFGGAKRSTLVNIFMICPRWPAGDSRPGSNSASNRGHLMASRDATWNVQKSTSISGKRSPVMTTASPFDLVRHHRANERIFLYAFDLIELNGDDLRRDPLEGRKATLQMILAKSGPGIRFNEVHGGRRPDRVSHTPASSGSKASSQSGRTRFTVPAARLIGSK